MRPKGSKKWRVRRAIHLAHTSKLGHEEIGEKLGVSGRTVRKYLKEEPAQEVQEKLVEQQAEARVIAYEELKRQLREAGERSRSAEKPVKIYKNDEGELEVRDVYNDDGDLVTKKPVPQDIEILSDDKARYFGRQEVREILDRIADLLGIKEAQEVELTGAVEHEHQVTHELGEEEKQQLDELFGGSE